MGIQDGPGVDAFQGSVGGPGHWLYALRFGAIADDLDTRYGVSRNAEKLSALVQLGYHRMRWVARVIGRVPRVVHRIGKIAEQEKDPASLVASSAVTLHLGKSAENFI